MSGRYPYLSWWNATSAAAFDHVSHHAKTDAVEAMKVPPVFVDSVASENAGGPKHSSSWTTS